MQANSLKITFLNEPELICLHTDKWFQVLLFIICSQLIGFKYNNGLKNSIQLIDGT